MSHAPSKNQQIFHQPHIQKTSSLEGVVQDVDQHLAGILERITNAVVNLETVIRGSRANELPKTAGSNEIKAIAADEADAEEHAGDVSAGY